MSKPLLVLNPDAGQFRAHPTLLSTLKGHRFMAGVEVASSRKAEETRALAREAREEGREILMVAGGDGTIHQAVNGLLDGLDPEALPAPEDLPLFGILPLGTGNDLARSLGHPLDPWEALDGLDRDRVRSLDLIRFEGPGAEWCVNLVSGGLASPGEDPGDGSSIEVPGVLAYWKRGVEALMEGHPSYRLSLRLEGEEEMIFEAQNLVVGNGRFVAGGIPVTPQALLDDGLLDLLVVPELDVAEMGILFPRLLLGKHPEHEAILVRKVREVTFESEPELDLSLDGEPGRARKGRFRVEEGALRVLVGTEEEDRAFSSGPLS